MYACTQCCSSGDEIRLCVTFNKQGATLALHEYHETLSNVLLYKIYIYIILAIAVILSLLQSSSDTWILQLANMIHAVLILFLLVVFLLGVIPRATISLAHKVGKQSNQRCDIYNVDL